MNENGNEASALRLTRRALMRRSLAGGAAVALPWIVPARARGADGVAASERITLGVIGYGPRCTQVLAPMLAEPDVQCVAVADVQAVRRQQCKETVDTHYGTKDCTVYRDLRELLARQDIDAVLIATGDRWHTPASVLAARAGKDIYCEKPCSMTIAECGLMAETMHRYGRIYQAGTQRRSIGNFQIAQQLARSGKLGRLRTLHACIVQPGVRYDWLPAEPEPPRDEVDWDLWLGPCPWRPFNRQYIRGGWRGHNDLFAGYNVLEWGSHTVDLCQWTRGADETPPTEYEVAGEKIHARYADGVTVVMETAGSASGNGSPNFKPEMGTCPVRFVGDEGWVETGDTGEIEAEPASLKADVKRLIGARRRAGTDPGTHVRNFLDCVKSRNRTHSNPDVTRRSHVACHAAAIAWLLKRKVTLDPQSETFAGDEEANRLRSRAAREPWCL
jgi:predicted dehydrogenase